MTVNALRLAIALAIGLCSGLAAEDRPNILMILTDDQGYADVSAYGSKDLRTPAIDSLVSRGMRFDDFYANCPVCSPTRAALLSGRYPELVGVPGVIRTHVSNSWGYLAPDAVLLPSLLKQAGYVTGIVGKWHLGLEPENHPLRRGFSRFHGFLGDMMDDYYKHRRHGVNYMRDDFEEIRPEGHATDLFSDWAIDFIRKESKTEAPFFLYLAYNAPHTPIQPPADWLERVKKREPEMTEKRAKLVALIEHMDHGIGRVIDALEKSGAAKNTLVIFTSDNGGQGNVGANNAPWRGEKQEMYEGGLRVPMCAVWPERITAGARSKCVGATMDLFPTMAEAAGVEVPHHIDGVSLLPVFLGKSKGEELASRALYFTRREGGNRYMGECIWALRAGNWKLLKNTPFEPFELYDLKNDPRETKDLAKSNRQVYNRLATMMRAHIQRGGAVPWQRREP